MQFEYSIVLTKDGVRTHVLRKMTSEQLNYYIQALMPFCGLDIQLMLE